MNKQKYIAGTYLAFVLSKASREELQRFFPPAFERVICHHVTIAFKLNEPLYDAIIDVMGETPTVIVTGYIRSEHLECFTVEVNGSHLLNINGQHYHITHSLEAPAKPKDSSDVIRSKATVQKCNIKLSGKMELVKK